MNHPFTPSFINPGSCSHCKYSLVQHSNMAECECCSNIGPIEPFMTMLMCQVCIDKEKMLQTELKDPIKQNERVNYMNASIEASRSIDSSIQIRSDIFNAATVAIVDLQKSIELDSNIINKPYALAEILTERYKHFKSVIFEANETIIEAGNQQKAVQIYLNQLANKLRAEEREKLRISDINYQPATPKLIKPKVIKKTGKIDKVELKKYASELGVSDFTLQMLCVAKGISVEDAANMLRKTIKEAKSL